VRNRHRPTHLDLDRHDRPREACSPALTYLIARGGSTNERARAKAQRNEELSRQYIQEAAASTPVSTADELTKLADLRDRGAISEGDYEQAKTKVLG
jgi:hypothetical protein